MLSLAVPPGSPATLWAVRVVDNQTNAANSDGPDGLEVLRVDDSLRATLMQSAAATTGQFLVDQAQGLVVCVSHQTHPPSTMKFCELHMRLSSAARNRAMRAMSGAWRRSGRHCRSAI